MQTLHKLILLLTFVILFSTNVLHFTVADVPVSCEFPNVYGEWSFQKTKLIYTNQVIYNQCSIDKQTLPQDASIETFNVALKVPDIALLKKDSKTIAKGKWTLIWNQGMEIRFPDFRYFAFFNYTMNAEGKALSNCSRILMGTYHDNSVNAGKWGCFIGERIKVPRNAKRYLTQVSMISGNEQSERDDRKYEDVRYVEELNNSQKNWKASINNQFKGMTIGQLKSIYLKKQKRVSTASRDFLKEEIKKKESTTRHSSSGGQFAFNGETDRYEWISNEEINKIPEEFSWQDVNGQDYLTPVRDQGGCGSCYAFGTSEMLGMRVRIQSGLHNTEIFSPQAIVDCSPYSQGCSGGCVYLASKYAQDYGLVLDKCLPYNETMRSAQTCTITNETNCKKLRVSNYYNVGGYYGASNEWNIMMDVLKRGPIVAGFMVYNDFFYYKSGIYTHSEKDETLAHDKKLPKFYYINHTLIIYGWGIDKETNQKYWKVQNSWGLDWGMKGHAFVAKGDNTGYIESDAEAAIPIISH